MACVSDEKIPYECPDEEGRIDSADADAQLDDLGKFRIKLGHFRPSRTRKCSSITSSTLSPSPFLLVKVAESSGSLAVSHVETRRPVDDSTLIPPASGAALETPET